MAHIVFDKGAVLRGVRKVSVVRIARNGRGKEQVLFRAGRRDPIEEILDGGVRVTIVRPGSGVIRAGELDDAGPRRRKQAKVLKPLERSMRKAMRRQLGAAQIYLARHERSNRRKRDGWLKDLPRNIYRAVRDSD
ncbi:hypothetical protein [Roseomonas sp. 18066]|uniref:DUF6312 domain-containing protein n=1 Tax=Roseomonas sp. 18066 TaxID=2681412 RepID=UPI00135A8E64|nr:hypothetical protein [Roseomonas sp. 18066]